MYRLRELEEKDLPIINSWRNNKELMSRKIKIKKFIVPFIILGSVFSVATSTFFILFIYIFLLLGIFW